MLSAFYVAAVVAIVATAMTITRLRAVHALLYLVISLLAVAVVFYTLGAPLVAALEVIIYAGAIMVLFVFVMMTLNIGNRAIETERRWLEPKAWIGPAILGAILLAELVRTMASEPGAGVTGPVNPEAVSRLLFGPWLLGVELASMLLLAGIVAAYRLGQSDLAEPTEPAEKEKVHAIERTEPGAGAGGDIVSAGAGRPVNTP
jgi:NADH-quinone oxidoreductase subunit J